MTQEAPRDASSYNRTLIEVSLDSLVTITPDGKLSDVNSATEQVTGFLRHELIGTDFSDYFTEPDKARDGYQRVFKDGTVRNYPLEIRHRDGHITAVLYNATVYYDAPGKIGGVFASARDITERTQAEAEIHRLNAELEKRVIERTTQLAGANQELESFAYCVAHDLRSPLRSIDGFSLALLEDYGDVLDSNGKEYLRRVRAATQRMAQLIDDILKLLYVTRSELVFEKVDMSILAASVAEVLQDESSERGVTFVIKEGVTTRGDPRLLKVVLENLLSNAWKFTSAHATARIEFGSVVNEGESAYFVRDDGAGFEMKYVDKLFTTFQRLHTELEFPGAGIGLALVQHIIHRHGGRVWAEGAVEQGATIWFTLG
jgi:PAS domain S-box-containing protein